MDRNNSLEQPSEMHGETPLKERKFQDLRDAVESLIKVKTALYRLKGHIGIDEPPSACGVVDEEKAAEPTLVSTLNELPMKIRNDVEHILDMVRDIHIGLN